MFKGDELDENFVYTDQDMVSIITRIVNEEVDCFEIEEVQTGRLSPSFTFPFYLHPP
jgi:hypothetical protein